MIERASALVNENGLSSFVKVPESPKKPYPGPGPPACTRLGKDDPVSDFPRPNVCLAKGWHLDVPMRARPEDAEAGIDAVQRVELRTDRSQAFVEHVQGVMATAKAGAVFAVLPRDAA
jgi:hypothetical protein